MYLEGEFAPPSMDSSATLCSTELLLVDIASGGC